MARSNRAALLTLGFILGGCKLSTLPVVAASLDPKPRDVPALWRHIDGLELARQCSSGTAMLLVADLRRKSRDQGPSACESSHGRGLSETYDLRLTMADVGHERWGVLMRPPSPGRPTIVLVHGLFDSKYTRYLHVVAKLLIEHGFGVVIPDMRWHGCRFSNSLPTLGPGEAEDLAALARWVGRRYPGSNVGMIGFSLGALDVLHALSGPDAPSLFPAGAIAFSPPGDLEYTVDWLDRTPNSIFGLAFKAWIRTRMRALNIDSRGTGPFRRTLEWLAHRRGHGEDVGALLRRADPALRIPHVQRPTLIIVARDDPFFTRATVGYLQHAAVGNCYVKVYATVSGGHLGHFAAFPKWSARVITDFFTHSAGLDCPAPQGVAADAHL